MKFIFPSLFVMRPQSVVITVLVLCLYLLQTHEMFSSNLWTGSMIAVMRE